MIWLGAMCASIVAGALCLVFASTISWLYIPGVIFCVIAVVSPIMYIMHWVGKKKQLKCNECCRVLLCLPPQRRDAVEYYKAHTADPEQGATAEDAVPIDEAKTEKVEEKTAIETEEK